MRAPGWIGVAPRCCLCGPWARAGAPPQGHGRPCALHSPAPGHLQQQRLALLEEKLRLLAQARDEAQATCLQQKQMVAEAQARGSQLGLQVEALRRRLEELQQVTGTWGLRGAWPPPPSHPRAWQELSNKDQEKVAEVTRVRVELQEQNGRLQAELAAQEALKEKVAALERQLRGDTPPPTPRPAALQDPVSLVTGGGGAGTRSGLRGANGTPNPTRPLALPAADARALSFLPRSDGEWPPRGAAGPRERERLPPREAAAAGGGDRAHQGGGGPEGQLLAKRGPGLRTGVPGEGPEPPEVRGGRETPGAAGRWRLAVLGEGCSRCREIGAKTVCAPLTPAGGCLGAPSLPRRPTPDTCA